MHLQLIELVKPDPAGLIKAKGQSNIATRLKYGVQTSIEHRRKSSFGYCWE